MDETNSDTEGKWNIALEEIEKKFEIFHTLSSERLIKAGPIMWTVLRPLTMSQNVRPKKDKEDRDTSITR